MYKSYKRYMVDLETTTAEISEEETRVWVWGSVDIYNEDDFNHGRNIENMFKWFEEENRIVYYHNLGFDGKFIIDYLLNNGYNHVEKDEQESRTFTTLISDMGQFYLIEICFYKKGKNIKRVVIYDSVKLIPSSVEEIANNFDVGDLKKLDLDYNDIPNDDEPLTEKQVNYLKNDLLIPARALKFLFDEGMTRMTTSSNSLNNYKDMVGGRFNILFPKLKEDSFIRDSYKGGFTYLKDGYSGIDLKEGIVYDVNSLYPSIMMFEELPIGYPISYEGEYEFDEYYPLYVQRLTCVFEIKENMLPTLQLKNNMRFMPTEYIKSSDGEEVTLTLTNVDLELFYKHYDVEVVQFHEGLKFRSGKGMFDDFINHWTDIKIKSKEDGNASMYTLSKLMMNSLYGKFGTNPKGDRKIPYLNDKGIVSYEIVQSDDREPIYVAVASFITSYARRKTITSAQDNYKRFIYADTDSIHLIGSEEADNIKIHNTNLGEWSIDAEFTRARYIKQKMYLLDTNKGYITSVAGMRKSLQEKLNFDNFKVGSVFSGDLKAKTVKGGVILFDNDYTLK